ncbi:DUF202 domain-containing protein [Aeromicrobium sp.]|uniref:YidH family protein n=1 Tax=Aeromicrobium sp. TaxID=1871063 RepID=UPI0028A8D3B9|nr:DUF202 domain-containing protein [Aeromicrobium sp.]
MTTERPTQRWPQSVYGDGDEPDPRFSFANQRTLLAWVRTALALVLAAAVVDAVPVDVSSTLRIGATLLLSVLGIGAALQGWRAWVLAERALRHGQPLPSSGGMGLVLVSGVGAAAALVIGVALAGGYTYA